MSRNTSLHLPQLATGDLIGKRFDVRTQLGIGGAGQVYEAFDRTLERTVALKLLHGEPTEAALAKLRRETALAQTVTHHNVCRIYDFGSGAVDVGRANADGGGSPKEDSYEQDDRARRDDCIEQPVFFVSMELLDGPTLSRLVERDGPMDVDRALEIAGQVASGLEAAHSAGVIHRDVKPSNVIVADRAVLTDFGLSEIEPSEQPPITAASTGADAGNSTSNSGSTSSPMAGTPLCLAPEQVLGERVTQASDVYAFGVLLYYILCGTWPFAGKTRVGVAMARLDSPPIPLTTHRSDLPAELVALVDRCLQRQPADRPASMSEVRQVLEAVRHGPPSAIDKHRTALLVAGLLAMVALIAAAWLLTREPTQSLPTPSGLVVAGETDSAWITEALPHLDAGNHALSLGDPKSAVAAFEQALATNPEHPATLGALSRAWFALGDTDTAQQFADRSVAVAADLPREEQLLLEATRHAASAEWTRAVDIYRALWEFYPHQHAHGLNLARMLDRAGELDAAKSTITTLRERMTTENAHVDFTESLIEYHRGNYRESAGLAKSAGELAREKGAEVLEASAYDLEALTRTEVDSDLEPVNELLDRAARIFENRGLPSKQAAVLRRRGGVARRLGDLDQAESHYEKARVLALEAKDSATHAGATGSLALVLDSRGQIQRALELKREVLANYERRNVPQGVAITTENIGISLMKLGRLQEALDTMLNAERQYRELGDRLGIAWAPYNQGRVWFHMGDLDLAEQSFQLGVTASEKLENPVLISYLRYEQARIALERDQLDLALELSQQCLDEYVEWEQSSDLADTQWLQSQIHAARADYQTALPLAQEAADYRVAASGPTDLAEALTAKLSIALASQDAEKAAEAAAELSTLADVEHAAFRLNAAANLVAHKLTQAAGAQSVQRAADTLRTLRDEADSLGLALVSFDLGRRLLEVTVDQAQYDALYRQLDELARQRSWHLKRRQLHDDARPVRSADVTESNKAAQRE